MQTTIDSDPRWQAVVARDPAADFFYSVRTTGVYCRPSCAARLALRANVAFHRSCRDAEAAGFRPCKRCKPNAAPLEERRAEIVARACRLLDESEAPIELADLARTVGTSRFHLHRVFKDVTGVTPRAYAAARRAERLRDELDDSPSVTSAIYGAGFQSSGHFYADAPKLLGMTPTQFRAGGTGVAIRFALGRCSLGTLLVAATAIGVCAILFGDDDASLERDLRERFPNADIAIASDLAHWVAHVIAFIEEPAAALALPLDIRGTAFQRRVWEALQAVPAGETVTYADVAARIGRPHAARAVAAACAANPIAVAIPCHRVVRSDRSLSGYRWGIERKRALLDREAIDVVAREVG
ncbi:MAG: bifunctional DNA-binding transcriptional regulator/O6-methylguanine-DNA methyltransferase Ada [Kofleriaceae bacterium]